MWKTLQPQRLGDKARRPRWTVWPCSLLHRVDTALQDRTRDRTSNKADALTPGSVLLTLARATRCAVLEQHAAVECHGIVRLAPVACAGVSPGPGTPKSVSPRIVCMFSNDVPE